MPSSVAITPPEAAALTAQVTVAVPAGAAICWNASYGLILWQPGASVVGPPDKQLLLPHARAVPPVHVALAVGSHAQPHALVSVTAWVAEKTRTAS